MNRFSAQITCELWKVSGEVGIDDLLLQNVRFIEEEDDWRLLEPWVRDDGLKQSFTLLHTVLIKKWIKEQISALVITPLFNSSVFKVQTTYRHSTAKLQIFLFYFLIFGWEDTLVMVKEWGYGATDLVVALNEDLVVFAQRH